MSQTPMLILITLHVVSSSLTWAGCYVRSILMFESMEAVSAWLTLSPIRYFDSNTSTLRLFLNSKSKSHKFVSLDTTCHSFFSFLLAFQYLSPGISLAKHSRKHITSTYSDSFSHGTLHGQLIVFRMFLSLGEAARNPSRRTFYQTILTLSEYWPSEKVRRMLIVELINN